KVSCYSPREACCPLTEVYEPQRLMQVRIGKPGCCPSWHLMLLAQPLTQPVSRVLVYGVIGFADRSKAEVIAPTAHHAIELHHDFAGVLPGSAPVGYFTHCRANPGNPFLCRPRADVTSARLWRVTPSKRVSQKIERLYRHLADVRLSLVDRQYQPRHHVRHHRQRLGSAASTTDHEVVGIVNDVSVQTPLVSQRLPPQHEPAHVQITERWADRRVLRRTLALVLVAGSSLLPSPIIGFLHRRFQP